MEIKELPTVKQSNTSSGKFVKHYIHQNFPFALVGSGKSSHSIKMLPLTEVKGNC